MGACALKERCLSRIVPELGRLLQTLRSEAGEGQLLNWVTKCSRAHLADNLCKPEGAGCRVVKTFPICAGQREQPSDL